MANSMEEIEVHKLESGWSIWELREQSKGAAYGDKLYKLCTFRNVEEFWGYWNNIPSPSKVLFDGYVKKKFVDRTVECYAIFKEGIVPEWEDPANKTGGEWSMHRELTPESLDKIWEILVLGAIGELIDPGNEITGLRIIHRNSKRGGKDIGHSYRYEIWLRSTDRALADEIRRRVMDFLNAETAPEKWSSHDFRYKTH